MTDTVKKTNTSRRSFFLRGGAALGAGVVSAATAAAAPGLDGTLPLKERLGELQRQLAALEDKEAIRQLFLTYNALLENRAYEAVLDLFADDARVVMNGETFRGREDGIRQLFIEHYAARGGREMHTAFQQDQARQKDAVVVSEGRRSARASFHARVYISRPLGHMPGLEEMARLQGHGEDARWEAGRFEMDCINVAGNWKIGRLAYRRAV